MNKWILYLPIIFLATVLNGQNRKLIIDADTGNEIDDALALVYALKSGQIDILGICAEQWKYQLYDGFDTMEKSWELNNEILRRMELQDIPSLKGSELSLKRHQLDGPPNPRWGEAVDFIIEKAMEMPEDEKLSVICLGAFTNIASAILKNPEIVERVELYLIGAIYHYERNAWDKNEFNVGNDLNAFNVLLNTEGLKIHMMPANLAGEIVFQAEETLPQLDKEVAIEDFLRKRWTEVVKGENQWIMWDLAIIEAFLHPQHVEEVKVHTPPENVQREILLYTEIDAEDIKNNFWDALKSN